MLSVTVRAGDVVTDTLGFVSQSATSVAEFIKGNVSGVMVSNVDGNINGLENVNIRGINSVRGDSQPLWVVDGVILNTDINKNLDAFKDQMVATRWKFWKRIGITGGAIYSRKLEDGMRLNTAVVKKLCSTDEISAEKKYKDPFKYKPSHTLVLYTNHLPKVGVTDAGTWRRLIVIPFNAKIEGTSDIKNYTQHLTENAGPFIMRWIIEGAMKAIEENFHFTKPTVVQSAIDRYRQENDWLGEFISEVCEVDENFKQASGSFYQEYRNYCGRTGEFTRSTSDFYSALEVAGYPRKKTNKGSFIYGLRIKEEGFME